MANFNGEACVNLSDDEKCSFDEIDICKDSDIENFEEENEDISNDSESESDKAENVGLSGHDVYKFYFGYEKYHGFCVRKDEVGYDKNHNIVMRQFLCNKASLRDKKHFIRDDRKKQHRPLTQTNCKAKLRVRLDEKIGKWKVVSFEASHNHIRSEDKYVSLIPTYHGLSTAEKAQVDSLHAQGKRTCHIMGFMMEQKWGCVGLGFNKKDVYNHISQQRRFKVEGRDVIAVTAQQPVP
ncbi:protein FAR1-RELATED SEQUENCE 11-like [Cajanus cajan]|uniref:protein FAR1-RELATED SEQUENCE 11-like n=1 Tax=Cajanus cajan TaxID=3821 RepID=UPI00098D7615|nr:protein FAR1-RELATED SEQUENCE 11-like [Cajanus cajan]